MNNIKKIIISFSAALLMVVIVEFIWSKFGSQELKAYVAIKDIYIGEKILQEDVKEITLNKSNKIKEYINNNVVGKVAKKNIVSDQIIKKGEVALKNVDLKDNESYEYIIIEVKTISDSLAYQLKKDDYINVYYTTKNKKLEDMFLNKEETVQNDLNITYRIFENIKVIGLYNTVGQEVTNKEQYNGVMLRVKKEDALIVSNIKDEGVFTISILK